MRLAERVELSIGECGFVNSITKRSAVIAVIGLGNTGLPVAQGYVEEGFTVCGIDIDADRVDQIRDGRSYLSYISNHEIQRLIAARFTIGTDFSCVAGADVVIVCVPTPQGADGVDLSFLSAASEAMAPYLKSGVVVILQSTVPPDTTDAIAAQLASRSRLELGSSLFVAFAPERMDPANTAGWSVRTTPRIAGGTTPDCTRRAKAVLEALCSKVAVVSDARTAEVTKLFENTFRLVNIALANEISDVCRNLDVSEREVVQAASTKPFGFLAHRPGPGIGGDCIAVVPGFLLTEARRRGVPMPIVAAALQQAAQRPKKVVELLRNLLARRGCPIEESNVLVLGVSYKENVNDTRNSPALSIIEQLLLSSVAVHYHDPLVPVLDVAGRRLTSQPCDESHLASYDCAILVTPHAEIVDRLDFTCARIVLDTRHVLDPTSNVEWL